MPMIESKSTAVVIPAYNEEKLLPDTLAGIPSFVDRIFVVDDASKDSTLERALACAAKDPRIKVISQERNRGAGAAVIAGYQAALEEKFDVVCVMNADNQMDPEELRDIALPVVRDEVDYTKANRLFTGEAWKLIPHYRYLGNAMLSLLTKIASGYWHVADSQAGYTAINRRMLELLDLENVYPRYGYPNDMLVHLNVWSARVRDVPSRPIYGIGEKSGIRLRSAVPRISWLLMKGFFWRMGHRYVIRDFHPLVFFYMAGFFSFLIGLALGSYSVGRHFSDHPPTAGLAILVALMMTFSVLFTLFAMWFDMETNKDLR
jgi:glycosyltransferase involved in cell wall biosynthesis